jgi:glycosyltransferase involved in cell wall biosynthesis
MAWKLLRRSEFVRRLVSSLRPRSEADDFDATYYIRQNPDVAASGLDPLYHYLNYGRDEGRLPHALARERVGLRLKDLCDPCRDEHDVTTSDNAFRVSVLTPAFNTEPRYLQELFQTLRNQSYSNWEWVVVDDGSVRAPTITALRGLAAADDRVRLILNPTNLGISTATNIALAEATGTHAALIDHDDLVFRDAFLEIYRDWMARPTTQLYYTDECKLNGEGELEQFWGKPDWSPAYLENTMYLNHLAVYEMDFLRALGGFRSEFDGTQDFDLALRAALRKPRVRHLPIFAYMWRMIPGSAASTLHAKHYAIDRQHKAVLEYARHKVANAEVVPGWGAGYWRIKYPLASHPPLLSYVIAACDESRAAPGRHIYLISDCIRSFEKHKFYPNREYVVVHDASLPESQRRQLQSIAGVVLVENRADAPNLSEALNLGVAHARGEFLCLLNDNVAAITPQGGEELVSYLTANDDVGAIGPLCLRADGTIEQNGVALLKSVGLAHAGHGRPRNFGGHQAILRCRRNALCVGAGAIFVKKSVFEAVGGFSEHLPRSCSDVDFGLNLRNRGYSSVIDPAIEVYQYEHTIESGTSAVERERLFLEHPSLSDPYFSKWLDQSDPSFRVNLHQ